MPLPGITDSTQDFRFALRGKRLAAVDDHSTITLHDTPTGAVIGKLKVHAEPIGWLFSEALTFSPDARLLATSGVNSPVKLWDVATQKELAALSSHKGTAQGLAFSPNGSLLASASWDDTVGFLRVATGKAEAPLTGISEGCSGVAFSSDGRTLAVACEDATVRLWNLATQREVAVLKHGNASSFTNIPSGTEATLLLTNVQPTSRQFAVVVTDSGGLSATSTPLASLTVLTPPTITIQPAVQIMTVGATATFTVTAAGTAPLAYQWRFNDADLAGKTTFRLVLANVQLNNAGNYTVVVTNAFGSVTSRVAALMFTAVHRFGGITANPDHSISLNLAGVVPKPFAPYYDIYPLDSFYEPGGLVAGRGELGAHGNRC